jgi:hypothetical protein
MDLNHDYTHQTLGIDFSDGKLKVLHRFRANVNFILNPQQAFTNESDQIECQNTPD